MKILLTLGLILLLILGLAFFILRWLSKVLPKILDQLFENSEIDLDK